jgi:hypothetical protein
MADYMRNKSFDTKARNLFQQDEPTGNNQLDLFGKHFTRLINDMQEILNSFSKLKLTAIELKKMKENFLYAENIIDRNIWDRKLKPPFERVDYKDLEDSLHQVFF